MYYQWGERGDHARFIRVGAGVGLGAARFEGTAQLSTGETVHTEKKSYSPRVYGNGYDIKVSDFSANLGYVFYF